MNSRFPSRKHTCPATNGAGIFIGGQMTDASRQTIDSTAAKIARSMMNEADLGEAVMLAMEIGYNLGRIDKTNEVVLEIKDKMDTLKARLTVPVTGEVKS